MSDHLKGGAQPCDREAITDIIESMKALFAETIATRGRRTDVNRNVFHAAAAAVIAKRYAREKTNSRGDAVDRPAPRRYLQERRVPQRDGRLRVATSGARVRTLKWPFTWVNTAACSKIFPASAGKRYNSNPPRRFSTKKNTDSRFSRRAELAAPSSRALGLNLSE